MRVVWAGAKENSLFLDVVSKAKSQATPAKKAKGSRRWMPAGTGKLAKVLT